MSQADSAVWLPVLPSFKDFGPALIKGAGTDADGAGKEVGRRFGVAAAAGMAAAAGAVAAGVGLLFNTGKVFADLETQIATSTGASGAELDKLTDASKRVATQIPASFDEIGPAVAAVKTTFEGIGNMTQDEFDRATANAINFSKAFGTEVERVTQVAGQMLKTGLVSDADEAFDLLTAASQKVPPALREDIIDATDEYGQFFAALGIDGESAMNALVAASDKGVFGIDKTGDAIKEFTIRATDMSKGTGEAYDALGLSQEQMTAALLKGGDDGAAAFQKIITALQDMDDPVAQSQAALALFGTPLEDLGTQDIPKFIDALAGGSDALGNVEGAAARMGESLNSGPMAALDRLKNLIMVGVAPAAEWLFTVVGDVLNRIGDGLVAFGEAWTRADGSITQAGFPGFMEQVAAIAQSLWGWIQNSLVPALMSFGSWVQQNSAWLGLFATVIGSAAGAIGLIVGVLNAWKTATAAVTAAKLALGAGMKALTAIMAANPFGVAIVAITALVAAAVYAYNNFETFRTIVDGAWNGIKAAVSGAWTGVIQPAFAAISQWVTGTLGPAILNFWRGVIIPAWAGIQAAVKAAGVALGAVFAAVVGAVAGVGNAVRGMAQWWASTWASVTSAAASAWARVTSAVSSGVSSAVAMVSSFVARVVGFFVQLGARIGSAAASAWSRVTSAVSVGVSAAANFVASWVGRVVGFYVNLGSRIVSAASSAWSRVTSAISSGASRAAAFISTWVSRIIGFYVNLGSRIVSAASSAWSRVTSAISSGVNKAASFVSTWVGRIVGFYLDLGRRVLTAARNAMTNATQAFRDGLSRAREAVSGGIDRVMGFFRDLPNRIKRALGNLGGLLKESGRSLLSGFRDGIMGGFERAKDAVKSGLEKIRRFFPFSPAKEGPFSGTGYTTYSGTALSQDFADAIAGQSGYLAKRSREFTAAADLALTPSIGQLDPTAMNALAMTAGWGTEPMARLSADGVPGEGALFPEQVTLVVQDGPTLRAFVQDVGDQRLAAHVAGLTQPVRQHVGSTR